MKHILHKSIKEEIELKLDSPRYVNYLDGMYYRFVPINDGIEITAIYLRDGYFSLDIRRVFYETDFDAFNLAEGYKEISPDEFYELATSLLDKYNLLPLSIFK